MESSLARPGVSAGRSVYDTIVSAAAFVNSLNGGLRAPPKPPDARGARAEPWRPSITRYGQAPKASSPVMSRPMISVWMSWVPS